MQVIQTQPMTPAGRFQYGGGPKYGGGYGGPRNPGGPYGPVGGRPGMTSMQSIEFDGKRLRKAVARKTVDYNAAVVEYLENRVWQRDYRDARALQPDSGYYTRLMPPLAMLANPINAVTTKFVRTSTNKMRCPIFCVVAALTELFTAGPAGFDFGRQQLAVHWKRQAVLGYVGQSALGCGRLPTA
ncbi:hypothetical protein HPB52_000372 [Rhipicephalus sanguineus]|uniref:Uncharacterized protein n=1 Tax=Rhipicephalus sanguineus TaxID=34632 RepID=A0A9D4PUI9_RHISA|nr:hypothetical protein HPB52_000372 [Rhipicephalus sanguineus]